MKAVTLSMSGAAQWFRTLTGVFAGVLCATGALLLGAAPVSAQQQIAGSAPPAPPAPAAPRDARQQAPFDPTGYWESIITQNWRFRMIVPGRGEYVDIPINEKGKAAADAWSPSQEEAAGKQCEAYGAPALMRQPEQLHITWQDGNTLRIDTDNGMQTRMLRFKPAPTETAGSPSWQGHSVARWESIAGGFGTAGPKYGSIEVHTDDLLPGLLRKNGVPYSASTKMTEYWEVHTEEPAGDVWMTITTEVDDPVYLRSPYSYESIFKKEPDGSRWDPAPCTLRS